MIFVSVIWASFDFRPYKKKIKKRLCKKKLFEKVFGPTSDLIWHGSCHVAVVDYTILATWHAT